MWHGFGVIMCLNPSVISTFWNGTIIVPCNKCIECKLKATNEWSYRLMLEKNYHDTSCFITLTYNEDNIPAGNTLSKTDYRNFIKAFREYIRRSANKNIRYFGCGEYGSKYDRPHYHFIIFGWKPEDLFYFFTDENGFKIYKSPKVAKIWKKGFVTVGVDLTIDTVKYVAKYMQKPSNNDKAIKPFITMSNRPGIGYQAIKYEMFIDGKVYVEGKFIKLPRYFRKVLQREFPEEYEKWNNEKLSRFNKFCSDSLYKNIGIDTRSDFWQGILNRRKKWKLKKIGKSLDKNFCIDYNKYRKVTMRKK